MRRVPLSMRLSCWFNVFNQPKIQQQEPTCASGAGHDHGHSTEARWFIHICITIRAPIVLFFKKKKKKSQGILLFSCQTYFSWGCRSRQSRDASAGSVERVAAARLTESCVSSRHTCHATQPPNISDLNPARQHLTHRLPCVTNVSGWSLRSAYYCSVSQAIKKSTYTVKWAKINTFRLDLDCLLVLLLLLLFLGGQLDLSAFNQNVEL